MGSRSERMFEKEIVIDGRGHLLGRLASTVAKELLCGQQIVVTRCEQINISGTHFRNKIKFWAFLRKRTNTNPKKGPIHFRAPSKILWRIVRGMIPHKTARGAAAMSRLKVFDGMPEPYYKKKKMVVPQALRVTRLKPKRPYTTVGHLAEEVGYKHLEVVQKLEAKRVEAAPAYNSQRKAANVKAAKAKASKVSAVLAEYGY